MSPIDSIRGINVRVQKQILPGVPKRWQHQLSFGLQAYGLRAFQSATGNARMVVPNANTAARKSERLLANRSLGDYLGKAMDSLGLVRPGSLVNIDHSDMNGLTALVGALQTRKGRSLPIMIETTYAHHIPADSDKPRWQKLRADMVAERKIQSFTGHTVNALQSMADRLGFWPRLVFDRGFGNESIVTHLQAEGAVFYIRLKAGRFVEFDGQRTAVEELPGKDATVNLFGLRLRVIRSPKSRRAPEPWYILTNDFDSSRERIVRIYYYRFEIEETFRDIKHIFELKRTRLNKPCSLKVLLWMVSIGIALLYLATGLSNHASNSSHPKKQTSWLRQSYEQLQQAYNLMLWGGV